MAKPLKFYQTLKQPPRSMKNHGKHRRAGAPAYGDPVDRTDHGAGGAGADRTITISWSNVTWIGADFAKPECANPDPPAIPYAGIRTGEIIGHRLWWVIIDGGLPHLCSLAHRRMWAPGETIKADLNELVNAMHVKMGIARQPVWGGTYAFADRNGAFIESIGMDADLRHYREWSGREAFSGFVDPIFWRGAREAVCAVIGTIKMWGEVIEHETGYRSEFARLHSIDEAFGGACDLAALRERYGVSTMSALQ